MQWPTGDLNFHSNQTQQLRQEAASSVKAESREEEKRNVEHGFAHGRRVCIVVWKAAAEAKAVHGACIMAFPYCATQMDTDNTQTRTRSEL